MPELSDRRRYGSPQNKDKIMSNTVKPKLFKNQRSCNVKDGKVVVDLEKNQVSMQEFMIIGSFTVNKQLEILKRATLSIRKTAKYLKELQRKRESEKRMAEEIYHAIGPVDNSFDLSDTDRRVVVY